MAILEKTFTMVGLSLAVIYIQALQVALVLPWFAPQGCRLVAGQPSMPTGPCADRAALLVSGRSGWDRLLCLYPFTRLQVATLAMSLGRPVDCYPEATPETLLTVLTREYRDVVVHGHGNRQGVVLSGRYMTEEWLRSRVEQLDLPGVKGLFIRQSCGAPSSWFTPTLGDCLVAAPERNRGWRGTSWYVPQYFFNPQGWPPPY